MERKRKVALVMLPILIFLVLISVSYAMTASVTVTTGDTTPPIITILSPQNATYYSNSTPLTFTINEPTSLIKYKLDGVNYTITGNTIITGLINGPHNIIVYAKDTSGNEGSSNRIYFKNNASFYLPWETSYISSESYPVIDIELYNSKLYWAANNKLYVFDGNSWNLIQAPTSVLSINNYTDGKMYVTGSGGKIYSFDGSNFNQVFNTNSQYAKMLGVYNNRLYAATYLAMPAKLYYFDGSWHEDTAFSSILVCPAPFCSIDSMVVNGTKMYVGSGGKVYQYNGTWSVLRTYDDVYAYQDMKFYNNKLYLATRDQSTRCPMYAGGSGFCGRVIEYDGTNWNTRFDYSYPTYNSGYWMYSLEVYNGRLYAGTANKIYMSSDGINWQLTFNSLEGAQYALTLKAWNGKIYVGFGNGVMFKDDMLEPLQIKLLSPQNTTYATSSVPLTFTTNRPASSISYSLDNKPNITIVGNTTLSVADGSHKLYLYAKDEIGSVKYSNVYFTVNTPKPDLIIEDIWTSGSTINYRIKNQGKSMAGSSYSKLWVDDVYKINDFVNLLTADSSSNEYFSYNWKCSGTSDTIKVCADANNNVFESNENNNCLTKVFTCPTSCKCTVWKRTAECCSPNIGLQIRICNPAGCVAEERCSGACYQIR